MSIPEFLIWHCAGCGAPAAGKTKPCNCATNIGVREGPSGRREQTYWDEPPDPRDATISALRSAAAKAREALEPFAKEADEFTPLCKDVELLITGAESDGTQEAGAHGNINIGDLRRARFALATLDEVEKGEA